MFGKLGNYLLKKAKSKTIGKIARWGFISVLTLFGPGSVVGVIGIEGLIAATAITQSGIIEYSCDKIL